jgi:phage shock protein C
MVRKGSRVQSPAWAPFNNYRIYPNHMKRLVLSQHDKKISGLCAGLADYLNIDVSVVRLVALVLIIMSGVIPGLLIYFIAAAIIPKEGEVK